MSQAQDPEVWTAERAFLRYEALRAHLPQAAFAGPMVRADTLAETGDRFDGYILDAFGVLNVGETAIPGAIERVAWMRAQGKRLVVLTNGASQSRAAALAKYRRMGFDFAEDEVVASRDLAAAAVRGRPGAWIWAAITAAGATFEDIEADLRPLDADPGLLDLADGFVFLGSEGWTAARQGALVAALRRRPRPVIVANPDVVAPRERGLSLEPGHFAHEIAAASGVTPEFHGKPYGGAFEAALNQIGRDVPGYRVAMVGDTLHTDVLGAQAAGVGSVLVAGHGLFRGADVERYMARSGIYPTVLAQTT